ncbi:MAG TPA: hypothetical protein VGD67_14480 [Pseudonocardiaceae bacterium]
MGKTVRGGFSVRECAEWGHGEWGWGEEPCQHGERHLFRVCLTCEHEVSDCEEYARDTDDDLWDAGVSGDRHELNGEGELTMRHGVVAGPGSAVAA